MNTCLTKDERYGLSLAARLFGASLLTMGLCSPSMAAEPVEQIDEVDVVTARQSALDAEAISLSDTPDAEPSVGGKTSIVIGVGARVAPVYDGSKSTYTIPVPYVDIHGLVYDRLFVSDIRGIGFNVVDLGAFRTGLSLNYDYLGGRTSSDAPRLRGLPDISRPGTVGAFMTYAVRPFAFEIKVNREFGSQPGGVEVQLGASVGMAPTPRWHVSFGVQANWGDAQFNQKYFGVTAAEATQASASGNPMPAYTPGSGLDTVGFTSTSIYALTEHWGVGTRLGLRELIGSAARNSPLTERTFGVDFAVGAIYKF